MTNLVTITSAFYDRSGKRLKNLSVKSRYKSSSRENLSKTDPSGLFIFQASPDRVIEILAKPPNAKDYTIFKTVNSSNRSSSTNPIKITLPKTIDEYRQVRRTGLVTNTFKVVDVSGKAMPNFPIQTRPKGGKSFERITDENGLIEVLSSPDRDIEFLVLTTSDEFIIKKSMNSGSGSVQAINVQLNELHSKFLSHSEILIVDRDENIYTNKNTNVEMEVLSTGGKKIYTISNGRLSVTSMVGQKLKFTVLKPDGKPLESVFFTARRIKEKTVKIKLDVDVTKESTDKNEPELDKKIEDKVVCKECGKNLNIDMDFIEKIAPKAQSDFKNALLLLPSFLEKYDSSSCKDLVNILAQGKIETEDFKKLIESMYYTKKSYTGETLYKMMITNFTNSFKRHGMENLKLKERYKYVEDNLMSNDPAIAQFLYSVPQYPNNNYRGRGLIHLTHFETYVKCAKETGLDIEKNPSLVQTDFKIAVETATWFWKYSKINSTVESDTKEINSEDVTNKVTRKVNPGMKKAAERRIAKKEIAKLFIAKYGVCK